MKQLSQLIKELSMERAVLKKLLHNFLYPYAPKDLNQMDLHQLVDEYVEAWGKNLNTFDTVEDPKDLPKVVRNEDEAFIELFSLLNDTFNFNVSPEDIYTEFVVYLDKQVEKL